MDLSKYKSLFVSESLEHLEAMTKNLLDLEKNPSEKEVIEELFRHAHSIKGMASSMGYTPVELISHRIEDLMDDVRKGRHVPTSETIEVLLQGRDALERYVKEVGAVDEPVFDGHEVVVERVKVFRDAQKKNAKPAAQAEAPKTATTPPPAAPKKPDDDFGDFDGEVVSPRVPAPAPSPSPTASSAMPEWPDSKANADAPTPEAPSETEWVIRAKLSMDSEAPAARAFLAIKRIGNLGKMVSEPSLDDIKRGKFDGKVKINLKTDADMSKIGGVLDGVSDIKEYAIEPVLKDEPQHQNAVAQQFEAAAPSIDIPHTLKVETRSLDKFVNLVGELLTVKSGLREIARNIDRPDLHNRLDRLEMLIHELHSQVMDIRMMPIESITARFPRIVRDLSRQAGKEIDFAMTGQDVDLDRAILERLADPLIHLIRNSIDHGIEPPDERERLRKPRKGKLTITASREKDYVAIEIIDDGKGIDVEVVKESAIGKGIITAEAAENMSYEEALMLICVPGFSTAQKVTFISGRGVGMDIVKSSIENIGGTLRLSTQLGKGTRTTLMLPRTVSIMNVLLVSVAPQMFAVPINKLLRTIEITKEDFQLSQKGEMILFDGEPVPVYDLRKVLRLSGSGNGKALFPTIVIEHGRRRFAFMVDDFLGQEEAFIRPLGKPINRIEGLSGVMTRGDGKPVFVLDVGNLV